MHTFVRMKWNTLNVTILKNCFLYILQYNNCDGKAEYSAAIQSSVSHGPSEISWFGAQETFLEIEIFCNIIDSVVLLSNALQYYNYKKVQLLLQQLKPKKSNTNLMFIKVILAY